MLHAVLGGGLGNVPPHRRDYYLVPTEVLYGDMSAGDILGVLEELEFAFPSALRAVRLDRDTRDFIVSALRRHTAG